MADAVQPDSTTVQQLLMPSQHSPRPTPLRRITRRFGHLDAKQASCKAHIFREPWLKYLQLFQNHLYYPKPRFHKRGASPTPTPKKHTSSHSSKRPIKPNESFQTIYIKIEENCERRDPQLIFFLPLSIHSFPVRLQSLRVWASEVGGSEQSILPMEMMFSSRFFGLGKADAEFGSLSVALAIGTWAWGMVTVGLGSWKGVWTTGSLCLLGRGKAGGCLCLGIGIGHHCRAFRCVHRGERMVAWFGPCGWGGAGR